ncbi:hypothetical protein [Acinetobacter higginsii]|uniref:hypothetical protein n=1 Tax=Acinetobacter higginsii TaxID=70347 RepID=UPI001F4AC00F|nr:hypothetical protein [Acinetobacter higginsii]MCH7381157.1 hypothetical protein [Acinetobacter higginsii]
MFVFSDISKVVHFVNLDQVNNVHITNDQNVKRCTFHFVGQHTLSVVVDEVTLHLIESTLEEHGEPKFVNIEMLIGESFQ